MIRQFAFSFFTLASLWSVATAQAGTPAAPAARWRMAKVLKIEVLESFPVQYDVTYVARCNDAETQVVKFVAGTETVIGVAVRRGPKSECAAESPKAERKKLRFKGEASDSATVRKLH